MFFWAGDRGWRRVKAVVDVGAGGWPWCQRKCFDMFKCRFVLKRPFFFVSFSFLLSGSLFFCFFQWSNGVACFFFLGISFLLAVL